MIMSHSSRNGFGFPRDSREVKRPYNLGLIVREYPKPREENEVVQKEISSREK